MANRKTYTHRDPARSRATRSIPRSSKGHFVGQLVFDRSGQPQTLGFESLLEYQAALCLIYRPGFLDLEEQLAPLVFRKPDGRTTHHWFDYRLTHLHGRRTAVVVKPEKIAKTYAFKANMRAIRAAAVPEVANDMCVVTERNINPVTLHNAKLFHAARHGQPEVDQTVYEAIDECVEPIRIRDFLRRVGVGGAGFFSVARCIHQGHAVRVDAGPITGASLIRSRRAA